MIFLLGLQEGALWEKMLNGYADIINGIGCGGMQRVKDTDLQEVDSGSGKKARDMLRRTAFGANFALIGIENQDEVDYEFPIRNMQYDVQQYQKQATRIRKELQQEHVKLNSGEFMYGFKKDSRLNPIITIVLYSGKEKWDGPTRLHDILNFTDIPDGIQNMTPDYPINIIDIRRLDNTDVFKTDVKQVFDFIRYSENKQRLLELVTSEPYFQEMDEEAFDVITKYTNSKELVEVKKYEGEGGKKNVCKAIRDLMEDSRLEGREEGREAGREEAKIETARNLLGKLSKEEIAQVVGLPLAEVEEMAKEL